MHVPLSSLGGAVAAADTSTCGSLGRLQVHQYSQIIKNMMNSSNDGNDVADLVGAASRRRMIVQDCRVAVPYTPSFSSFIPPPSANTLAFLVAKMAAARSTAPFLLALFLLALFLDLVWLELI
jgi:hypothetical protein